MARRSFVAALAIALVAFGSIATPASARKKTGSYATPGCKSAPMWKIAYRLYFRGAEGTTTPRGTRAKQAREAARRYARQVGTYSRCGMRVRVDFFDEENAVFDAGRRSTGQPIFPRGAERFRKKGGYDAVFYRYPRQADDTSPGYTTWLLSGRRFYGHAGFPVIDDGRVDPEGEPWRNLILHEWLHMVVFFNRGADWLKHTDPVHAGCELEPYRSAGLEENDGPCIASGTYFRDLMRRQVRYQGKRYGITRRLWRRCGTPTKPTKKHRRSCY